jgi:threonine/homoserine/homoserine lactone efflux protein
MHPAEWVSLATVCLLGAMSPGPSLAVVMSITLTRGSAAGASAAISHGLGVAVYGLLTVAGLSAVLLQSPRLFVVLKLAGAAYLLWMAVGLLRSKAGSGPEPGEAAPRQRPPALDGFLVAFLNPKLAVFMLALFSQFIGAESSWVHRWIMVATVGTIDAAWYLLVTGLLSRRLLLSLLQSCALAVNRLFGGILLLVALTVIVTAVS